MTSQKLMTDKKNVEYKSRERLMLRNFHEKSISKLSIIKKIKMADIVT